MRRSVGKGIAISLFILLSLGIGSTANNGAAPKKSKKFDPGLQRVLDEVKKGKPLPAESKSPLPGKADWVDLIITSVGGNFPNLPGVVYRSKNGNVATVSARLDALQQIADDPNVAYVQAPHTLEKLSDTANTAAVIRISEITTEDTTTPEQYSITGGLVVGDVYTVRAHQMDNLGGTLNPAIDVTGTAIAAAVSDDDSGPDKDAVVSFAITNAAGTLTITVKASTADATPTTGWYAVVIERREPWGNPIPITETGVDNTDATKALALTRVATNATRARTLLDGGGSPLTGNGVIIGIIDSGIDITHGDFIDDVTGQSRIRFLWDQTISGTAPDVGFDGSSANDYGAEFDNATINANLTNNAFDSRDTDGHGTQVASIAGGDGSKTDGNEPAGRYAGVAYRSGATAGAEFIIVKSDLTNARVIDALNYIFRRAILLDRPCVINMSIGSQVGPHDGTGAIAQVIDQLTGCGRVVVLACGNSGTNGTGTSSVRATGTIAGGETKVANFSITPGGTIIDIWIDAAPGVVTASCTVTDPTGATVTAADGTNATGTLITAAGGTSVAVAVANQTDAPANGDTHMQVTLAPGSEFSSGTSQTWSITITRTDGGGAVAFDMYGTRATFSTSLPAPVDAGTLTDEATATAGIAVGAVATKFTWRVNNPNGGFAEDDTSQPQMGRTAAFSSRGPARGGATGDKPDVVAPGARVTGALSKDVPSSSNSETPALAGTNSNVNEDAGHWTRSGTSFAAPQVSGIVALMFQRNPQLGSTSDGATVRARLRSNTYEAPAAPTNERGAGHVDAFETLEVATKSDGVGAPAALAAPAVPGAPAQLLTDGVTLIPLGGTVTNTPTVVFRATPVDAENRFVRIEVEVKPVGAAFDGVGTTLSPIGVPGTPISVSISGLQQLTPLRWRVRTIALTPGAGADQPSAWVAFGTDPDDINQVDFVIQLPKKKADSDCALAVLPPPSSGPWWIPLAALALVLLAIRRFRKGFAVAAMLIACCASAFAQEDRLPPLLSEPTEMDFDLGIRFKASLWGSDWNFEALTAQFGEVESDANAFFTATASFSLYFNDRYYVAFDIDSTALGNEARATVGGFAVGLRIQEKENEDWWGYFGGVFGGFELDTSDDSGDFERAFGLKLGTEVMYWVGHNFRIGGFVEVRYIKWDYDSAIVNGDDEIGGFGGLIGFQVEFMAWQEARP